MHKYVKSYLTQLLDIAFGWVRDQVWRILLSHISNLFHSRYVLSFSL